MFETVMEPVLKTGGEQIPWWCESLLLRHFKKNEEGWQKRNNCAGLEHRWRRLRRLLDRTQLPPPFGEMTELANVPGRKPGEVKLTRGRNALSPP